MKTLAKKVGICLLLACSISIVRADSLLDAMDRVDVHQVKQLLENGYLAHSSKEYQKRVLKATDVLVKGAQEAALRFIPSYDGFMHMSAGTIFFTSACLNAYTIYQRKEGIILSTLNAIRTGLLGMVSWLELHEGWKRRCSARMYARTCLAKAREIEALVIKYIGQD